VWAFEVVGERGANARRSTRVQPEIVYGGDDFIDVEPVAKILPVCRAGLRRAISTC
jgi:hypothetical protein